MIRREFLGMSGKSLLSAWLGQRIAGAEGEGRAGPQMGAALPGTSPFTATGDFAMEMEAGMQRFLARRIAETPRERERLWQLDYGSPEAYEASVAGHRDRFRRMIGAVDVRSAARAPELVSDAEGPGELAEGDSYTVFRVRWRVFDAVDEGLCGLEAEGLLLKPERAARAHVVALPDADWTPEMLAGLAAGVPATAQFARRLAEQGCEVLIPVLINRDDAFSGNPKIAMTNEPHREWVYRMSFELGRHIIGYEVAKVMAAVDWFANAPGPRVPIGVMGYGEGGLIGFYAAALDARIDGAVVSGYFEERENVWKEPIYRDVWGLTREFGDAEIAALVAPRVLIVEACGGPEVAGPPKAVGERRDVACPNGRLVSPPLDSVQREAERARAIYARLGAEKNFRLVVDGDGKGLPGSDEALRALLDALKIEQPLKPPSTGPRGMRAQVDSQARMREQIEQMLGYSYGLGQESPERRREFWSTADPSSAERWRESTKPQREYLWDEVIGRIEEPRLPANARTRLIYDAAHFAGYEVMLDVWPEVFAYGILLVPRDIAAGERRAVVVCQHGFEGRAQEVADPKIDSWFYHHYGASLAERGFVVYAPQNPFVGRDYFRLAWRMGHPLKLSLYSFILGQHEQTLDWLATLPFVDEKRIGIYGMSYGGKTAIRAGPLLDRYALCICSGDFNDIVWSMTGIANESSFMFDDSYDLYEFNFANVADYAELAKLMAPRPFMVERGHSDGTSTDEHVAFEFAAVKRFYSQMGIGERAAIEYFDGGHTVHGQGTFEFLAGFLQ